MARCTKRPVGASGVRNRLLIALTRATRFAMAALPPYIGLQKKTTTGNRSLAIAAVLRFLDLS